MLESTESNYLTLSGSVAEGSVEEEPFTRQPLVSIVTQSYYYLDKYNSSREEAHALKKQTGIFYPLVWLFCTAKEIVTKKYKSTSKSMIRMSIGTFILFELGLLQFLTKKTGKIKIK